MLIEVTNCESGQLSLAQLVADLRGLYVAADPHDPDLRSDFETVWSRIDAEHELRTESWAPPGSAIEENLTAALQQFRDWVERVLIADPTYEHG